MDAILCRAKVQLSPTANGEMVFMPAGNHEIMPFSGGVGKPIKIVVDSIAAGEIEKQRAALEAKGKPAYFDFDHEDRGASFWPKQFIWRDGEGIVAKGDWTTRGKTSVEGKEYRYFSPVFYVDNKHADPAKIQCRMGARANMGALINDPAFHEISPLWARDAGDNGDADNNQNGETMKTEEQIAELRAKNQELEEKMKALEAKGETGEKYDSLKAESAKVEAEMALANEQARNQKLADEIKARHTADAKEAVHAAIKRGAILPKDVKLQQTLVANAVADPERGLAVIKAMRGDNEDLVGRVLGNRILITGEEPERILCKMSEIMARQRAVRGSKVHQNEERAKLAREFSQIYAAEFKGDNANRMMNFPAMEIDTAISASDVTDADYGTLAGTLVAQRVLELLKFVFPMLTSFTTDFSGEGATFGQTIMTRTVDVPEVVTYNTSTGWPDSENGTDDIPVVINNHKGVQISINEQTLASTVRNLFEEQAPASAYALAKAIIDSVYANITDANFPNNSVITAANMTRAALINIATQLDLQGVPNYPGSRFAILYSTYFGQLQQDSAITSLAAFQRPDLITNGPDGAALPINVAGFRVYGAPNLPTNDGNVNGFAGSKSALVLATRVPNDYTTVLPGASNGNVQTITDADIGISVMLVQYVNHQLGTATRRLALMWGSAPGQSNAGRLIKSNTSSGSSH